MASQGLLQALIGLEGLYEEQFNAIHLTSEFFNPGYLVALAAFARSRGIEKRGFHIPSDRQGYFSAIGIPLALWGDDDYGNERVNAGRNYSPMTHLANEESVDTATAQINGCLRGLAQEDATSPGLADLLQVVGELHDNVWSHGKASGFSMAQKWMSPSRDDYFIEFALADCGIGFLEETKRAGLAMRSHSEAINWCLAEGNSTKHGDLIDEFAQRLPPGFTGDSPYGDAVPTRDSENHHQGLGLAKLVQLAETYDAAVIVASGNAYYSRNEQGASDIVTLDTDWEGVAVSCRLRGSKLAKNGQIDQDVELTNLMDQLRA